MELKQQLVDALFQQRIVSPKTNNHEENKKQSGGEERKTLKEKNDRKKRERGKELLEGEKVVFLSLSSLWTRVSILCLSFSHNHLEKRSRTNHAELC